MRFIFHFFTFVFSGLLLAQSPNLDHYKALKFRNIGPAGMSGRITAIDVDLSNDNRILLGSASGGVWLSENGGISFKPIFDEQSNLAIGSIKINQKNPSEIWVGTGEGNPRNSLNTGNGIYKSLDGGKTWKYMGLTNTKTIHRIIIHRDDPDIVYVAAMGSPWGPNEERGVFKTSDGGKNWKKILYINDETGAADMIADPTNPNKLIVAMYEHGRKPWVFKSGGKGSGLHITYDGGETWKKVNDKESGLPKGELGRIGLAMSASRTNIIYALVESKENGLYKSTDGGLKWSLVQSKNIGTRPFYYAEIYVDPKNENRLYNVHTYLDRSDDGGKTFKQIADYGNAVHPDHHALWIHPERPEYVIDGNDGGANISKDYGESWTFLSNIPVGQFYHVNIDNDFPYNVYGGMQDNGSWAGPSSVLKAGGIRNTDFQELYFGDGFDVAPLKNDSRYVYAMSQGGSLGLVDKETGFTKYIKPVSEDKTFLRFNWNAALALDPYSNCGVYYGSQFVHYSMDCGDSWKIISPDLTNNDTTKQLFKNTGGLTPDVTGAETFPTILAIAPSAIDKNVVWVGTDDGNIQLTKDGGKSWENITKNIKGFPTGAWIPQIEINKYNVGEAFVIVNDYRRNNYEAYAYHTTDFGNNWTRIAEPKQITSFTLSIVQDPVEPNLLFLGADNGLYISIDKGKNWIHWNKGFPQVQVNDMKIHERERDLVLGTFGRALWILDDITPLRDMAKNGKWLDNDFDVFNANNVVDASYKSYQGVRFYAQGDFTGENDNIGNANFYVWSKPKEDKKEEAKKEDSKDKKDETKVKEDKKEEKPKLYILNDKRDTLRIITIKIDSGLQKFSWNLNQEGVRYIRRGDPEKDADMPGDIPVIPGKYLAIFKNKEHKDSTYFEVKADPRIKQSNADLIKKNNSQQEFKRLKQKALDAFEQIKNMKKSLKSVEALSTIQDDSTKTKLEKLNKDIKPKLDTLEWIFMLPEDAKGYNFDDDKITSLLGNASYYLGASTAGTTPNGQLAINQLEEKLNETINKINTFIDKDWIKYKQDVDSLGLDIFKEVNVIKK